MTILKRQVASLQWSPLGFDYSSLHTMAIQKCPVAKIQWSPPDLNYSKAIYHDHFEVLHGQQ